MRLHRLARKVSCYLPLAMVLSVGTPVPAQFREVQGEGVPAQPSVPVNLPSTKAPFSAPRQPATVAVPSGTTPTAAGSVLVAALPEVATMPQPTPVLAPPQATVTNPFAAFQPSNQAGPTAGQPAASPASPSLPGPGSSVAQPVPSPSVGSMPMLNGGWPLTVSGVSPELSSAGPSSVAVPVTPATPAFVGPAAPATVPLTGPALTAPAATVPAAAAPAATVPAAAAPPVTVPAAAAPVTTLPATSGPAVATPVAPAPVAAVQAAPALAAPAQAAPAQAQPSSTTSSTTSSTYAPAANAVPTAPTTPAAVTASPVSAIPPAPVAPQPFAFNQITPGSSLVSQLEAAWGTPAASLPTTTGRLLTYLAPGFRQIDVEVNSATQKVESLVIHLNEPAANDALASQLGLAAVRPVSVRDEHGTALGQGYPERGVLLGWAAVPGQVTQIVLEPVGGELFRLRAEQDVENRCELSLADLRQAVQFNPQDARAHWMLAELLWQVGRAQDAREACATAVKLDGGNSLYQLTQARLLSENGDLKQALLATQTLAEAAATPPLVRARAEYQWGNLMVMGPEPNLQEATTHHLKAIELASKAVTDPIAEDRRMAKDLLLDAHLAVAQDIALGNYQRQKEVVPKWLSRAKELAEDLVSREQGDPILQMEVYRTMLAANSVLDGNFDATALVDSAIQEGQRLLAQSSDRLYQQRVERELSELLYHAARIEQRCGRMTTAMQLVSNAVVLAESSQQNRQLSLFDQLMNGQLYFLAGSLHALQSEDHEEAVRWFDRSIPAFNNERLPELVDCTMFGDPLVSMGVSYWEVGQREKAVELTQAGAELMQQGVQAGVLEMSVLSVPYGNLAAMHRQMGNTDEAQHYATLLAKIESEAEQNRR